MTSFGGEQLPEYLYKYQPLHRYTIESIACNQVYFALAKELNDPLDCLVTPVLEDTETDVKNWLDMWRDKKGYEDAVKDIERKGWKTSVREEYEKGVRSLRETTAVLSLTQLTKSLFMFAHYADNHRGVCLEYKCRGNDFFKAVRQVDYPKTFPRARAVGKYRTTHEEMIRIHYFTKGPNWKDEEEWRIIRQDIDRDDPKGKVGILPPGTLTSITLGVKTNQGDEALMCQILNSLYPRPVLKKAKPISGSFDLDIEEIKMVEGR